MREATAQSSTHSGRWSVRLQPDQGPPEVASTTVKHKLLTFLPRHEPARSADSTHSFVNMTSRQAGWAGALMVVAFLAGDVSPLRAQAVEVAPFGGYRFGGDFFEIVTARPVDLDGAATRGVAVNVSLSHGLWLEGLFTHEGASLTVPVAGAFGPPTRMRVTIDHWLGGGLQEFGGRVRPFAIALIGLTRYANGTDSEIRFTVSAGGGVKLFATKHIGVRLDGRLFATIIDADATLYACSPGRCLLALNADVVWQAEFTTGLVFRLP
jgi:hypothetical protein